MLINFYIKYGTKHGEQIFVQYKENGEKADTIFYLNYVDGNLWHGSLQIDEVTLDSKFDYDLFITGYERQNGKEKLAHSNIDFTKNKSSIYNIVHENFPLKKFIGLSNTKPFKKVFAPTNHKSTSANTASKITHIFEVEQPFLQENKFVCLTGNGKAFNNFDEKNPLLFMKGDTHQSSISLDLSKETFPIEFKIGIYDTDKKTIIEYEPGVNHLISNLDKNDSITIIHLNHSFTNYAWKGAGINVPIFSLRTDSGWGTGEFSDLNLLADYAAKVGMKLIQLLPINDTTGAYTDKDSYPYSAITSFGLHPKFLNVKKMADASKVIITKEGQIEIERLNALSYSDHTGVVALKINILKKIFEKQKNDFTKSPAWTTFFEAHSNWLIPFAAFCTLRDKFKTSDFTQWKEFSIFDEKKIKQLSSKESDDFEAIQFWYFVQFNLHVQLEEALAYAQSKGVVLKADLPIGVGRLSADTWENTNLFVMEMQAGAPPDAFSGSGQNWSFPTYNIAEMAKDGFAWFRKRMQHLQTYFDAVRIDHVLGIFRIWSIPLNQVEGTMGKFVPALPINKDEFYNIGLHFDEYRFCEPFITEEILYEKFGNDTNQVKEIFFEHGRLKESFNDQRKVEAYFASHGENLTWQQGLYDLIANVILFKDYDGYHFRINMFQISSYKWLSAHEKSLLDKLYHHYFFEKQNELWRKEGEMKLEMMTDSSDMLLCAEDLGMVPDFTDEVLKNLDILSLQVQQMPKDSASSYSDTAKAKYESIVMPATHDMSPMRLWWEENRTTTQSFYNEILQEQGAAPLYCEPWICRKIVEKHLQSPAMWSIFLMQDILALSGELRLENPNDERINIPANPNHVWNYRMHISLENLIKENELNDDLKNMIKNNNR